MGEDTAAASDADAGRDPQDNALAEGTGTRTGSCRDRFEQLEDSWQSRPATKMHRRGERGSQEQNTHENLLVAMAM